MASKSLRDGLRSAQACVTAPEQYGQDDHEEGMGTQVRSEREVEIESRASHARLHCREIRGLPAHHRNDPLTGHITPLG